MPIKQMIWVVPMIAHNIGLAQQYEKVVYLSGTFESRVRKVGGFKIKK